MPAQDQLMVCAAFEILLFVEPRLQTPKDWFQQIIPVTARVSLEDIHPGRVKTDSQRPADRYSFVMTAGLGWVCWRPCITVTAGSSSLSQN